ncbi:dephospho-CoA kinase [Fructobacillus ficulneus]|uniref:Dephospho-CoA kinase n=1 Tax=Fructobacillus ficulneus TaxID=157463 RepID=A0A0K8MHG4_9LACO|nr:dephospho-CoA kinase [Fructobacillus ficulneus]GAO99623.1 dephospho-CoA kinase [Fructobacillus ficulneus]
MKIIGLTGSIATGKSAVTKLVAQAGYHVIDADLVAREVVEPGSFTLEKIKTTFGQDVIKNGVLDRKKLGERVFQNPALLKALTEITSPAIHSAIEDKINFFKMQGDAIIFIAIPLLYEQGYDQTDWFNQILVVATNPRTELDRLMDRDGLDEYAAQSRIKAQISIEDKAQRADVVFDNNGTTAELAAQVDQYLMELKKD